MNHQGRRGGGAYSRRGSSVASSSSSSTKRSFVPNIAAAARLEKPDRDVPGMSQRSNGEDDVISVAKRKRFRAGETSGSRANHHRERRSEKEGIIQSEGEFTFHGRIDSSTTSGSRAHVNGVKVEPTDCGERVNGAPPSKLLDDAGGSERRSKKLAGAAGCKLYSPEKPSNGFISDVPKVERIPMVLPGSEEPQFHRFLTKKAKRRLETGEARDEHLIQPKDEDLGEQIKRELLDDELEPSVSSLPPYAEPIADQRAVGAGVRLRHMMKESDGSLMLLQLPSTFALQRTTEPDGPPELVGKLQFLRDGRVVIRSAERTMDVLEAIPSGCYEIAANITTNTTPQPPPPHPPPNTMDEKPTAIANDDESPRVQRQESIRSENKLSVLGDIKHSFLCTDLNQR